MNFLHHRFSLSSISIAALAAFAAAAPAASACSVCGCSLSSDWASQGYGMQPGLEFDLNEQYYDQDDLRSGMDPVDRLAVPLPAGRELQVDTLTRNTTVGIDYVPIPDWSLALQVPVYDRFHSTVAAGDTEISESRASGIGDLRLLARRQLFNPKHSFDFEFGLKLPTGEFNQNFMTGPQAGTLLDRGLQLGSGTTDVITGASVFGRVFPYVGYFAQATAQQALAARDGFIPSTTFNLNLGLRYLNSSSVTPMLQVNARWDTREHGVEADTLDSGDAAIFLSPGITIQAGANRSLFAFLQLPFYERVNGFQLEPRWLLSVGLRWSR